MLRGKKFRVCGMLAGIGLMATGIAMGLDPDAGAEILFITGVMVFWCNCGEEKIKDE